MFFDCMAVGAGGFAGAVFRYLVGLIPFLHRSEFPLHTLIINFAGALLIGLIFGISQSQGRLDPRMILFLKVGVCGGFTTFSTFALESYNLLDSGSTLLSVIYITASVVFCIAGVYAGILLGTQR